MSEADEQCGGCWEVISYETKLPAEARQMYMKTTDEYLTLYPEFLPAWHATIDRNVRYALRQGMQRIWIEQTYNILVTWHYTQA